MPDPYRDEHAALLARLDAIVDEKRRLDAWSRELDEALESLEVSLGLERRKKRESSRRTLAGCALMTVAGIGVWGTLVVRAELRKAKTEAARCGADAIKASAELWGVSGANIPPCPTVQDLTAAKKLDAKKWDDPWGRPYRVQCSEDGYRGISDGPDGIPYTVDDIGE